jgi:SatD family (SatD)
MTPKYAVIIADIKGSKKMAEMERYEWQLFLKSAIVQVNENWASSIEAQFMITKGDEFQGVVHNIPNAHSIMIEFERLLTPLELRFGIGLGRIQKMGAHIPIEMDGPAFHRANTALNRAKKLKSRVNFHSMDPQLDKYINTLYSLIYAIKGRWSDINRSRYWKYKEMGTYDKVADLEGVSPQAVWDSLRNANAIEVIEAEKTVKDFLQSKMEEAQWEMENAQNSAG